ncbi:MAG TPA: YceI family protein [Candidatus Tyrphobacter sp.]
MKCNVVALSFATGVLALAFAAVPATAADAIWSVDTAASTATFSTMHFLVSRVTGTLPIKSASLTIPSGSAIPTSVTATLEPAGLDTHDTGRDASLRSATFLNVATYPQITFESTSVTHVDASRFTIAGNLTIHGVTRPVSLAASYVGEQGAGPALRLVYEAHTTIDRTQFGMTYGESVVGTSIEIDLRIEAVRP